MYYNKVNLSTMVAALKTLNPLNLVGPMKPTPGMKLISGYVRDNSPQMKAYRRLRRARNKRAAESRRRNWR